MSETSLAGIDVSRETISRLEEYARSLRRWTRAINLISPSSVQNLWHRHIEDSAQLLRYIPAGATHWLDLGSGGGLPGLVIAILAVDQAPDLRVTLVESDARKAAFLQTVVSSMKLRASIEIERAEHLKPVGSDVVSARALAPLSALLPLADRHLLPGGRAIFPKGRAHAQEIASALETWQFSVQKYQSLTDPDGVILCIEGLSRV